MSLLRSRAALLVCALVAQTVLKQAQPHAQQASWPPYRTVDAALPQQSDMQRFYQRHGPHAFWTEANWQIASWYLQNSAAEGLYPEDYRVTAASESLSRDMARTAAVLAFARDLRNGRAPLRSLDRDVLLPEPEFDSVVTTLLAAQDQASLKTFLTGLFPSGPEYRKLRHALGRYRAIAAAGGWGKIGASDAVETVQERLVIEYPSLLKRDATQSLEKFQEWHGLAADGKLSSATLAALNVSASVRVEQITANMERWRWLPNPLEASRLTVNVPAAMLTLWTEEKVVLSSRVIVGKPATRTPVLRAESTSLTLNPPWTVPRSISVNEMLPRLKRDHTYLRSQNIILLNGPPGDPHGLTVNWRALSSKTFPYRLQQVPGPKNALGVIKVEFPNHFDVYLHDTPGKAAFAGQQRALSHGCVRVEQILPLAAHVLSDNATEAAKRISDAIAEGKTRHLLLPRNLPVYLLYWTAAADARGEARFWPDIYGRDKRLLLKLQSPAELRLASQNVKCPTG
jgi:murein L,D-transpeptidase YcbB/YkuD